MFNKSSKQYDLPESLVTDESVFNNRRQIIKAMGILPIAGFFSPRINSNCEELPPLAKLSEANSFHQITHYNNYYEFSTNKQAVALLADKMPLSPWNLEVTGEVENR